MRNTARQTRENRTLTIDFQNEATYFQLLGDGKAFRHPSAPARRASHDSSEADAGAKRR
jgi:hypothetical protein